MDFSDVYKASIRPALSPNGQFIAVAEEYRLVIRDVESLQVVQLYSCLDHIQSLEWCCHSNYVLCRLLKRPVVQVWSVEDPDWACKLDEGPAGIDRVCWSPDGQHLVVVAAFQIRLTIWSLRDRACVHVVGPKHGDQMVAFSPDGSFLALVERSECKDYVSLLVCESWRALAHVPLGTQDAAGVAWAPDSGCLAVWDTPLAYLVLVISLDGVRLAAFSAYQDALGLRSVAWAPSGNMLALGSYDQAVRVLNATSWEPLATLHHSERLAPPAATPVVYQELEEAPRASPLRARLGAARIAPLQDEQGGIGSVRARYVVCELPVRLPAVKPPLDKPNPKIGVGLVVWSSDGHYFATRCESMAGAVWVWDAATLDLISVLQQVSTVRAIAWSPTEPRLAICTGGPRLYLWSAEGASCIHIPLAGFNAASVQWAAGGKVLALAGKNSYCCAYLNV